MRHRFSLFSIIRFSLLQDLRYSFFHFISFPPFFKFLYRRIRGFFFTWKKELWWHIVWRIVRTRTDISEFFIRPNSTMLFNFMTKIKANQRYLHLNKQNCWVRSSWQMLGSRTHRHAPLATSTCFLNSILIKFESATLLKVSYFFWSPTLPFSSISPFF